MKTKTKKRWQMAWDFSFPKQDKVFRGITWQADELQLLKIRTQIPTLPVRVGYA